MTFSTENWIGQELKRFDRIRVEHTDFDEALQIMEAQAAALGADAVLSLEPQVDSSGEPPVFIVVGVPVRLDRP